MHQEVVGGFHTIFFSEKLSFVVWAFLYSMCYVDHVFLVSGRHIWHSLQLSHIYRSRRRHCSISVSWEFKALRADVLHVSAPFLKPALRLICLQDELMWGMIKQLSKREEGLAQLAAAQGRGKCCSRRAGANQMPWACALSCTPSTDSSSVGYTTIQENSGKK